MFRDYFVAARPYQWYKNALVFLAIFFSGNLLSFDLFLSSFVAFLSFCALSSATYLVNDVVDRRVDRLHPEKRLRPIASGRVGVLPALFLACALLAFGIGLSFLLPFSFTLASLFYIAVSQVYTVWLKDEAFADIIAISVNFVTRAVSGAFAIGVWVSPWLIAGVFFLAFFVVVGKRRGEFLFLGSRAASHRKSLKTYDDMMLGLLSTISTSALMIAYSLYVFLSGNYCLYLTVPFAVYAVLRYGWHCKRGDAISRNPHLAFRDARLVIACALWFLIAVWSLYLV